MKKKEKPNVQKISTNLQKPEMKSDINLNLNSNDKNNTPMTAKYHMTQRIPAPLPDFPYIGEY